MIIPASYVWTCSRKLECRDVHNKEGGCEFDAICLQETWLSEESDKSLLGIEEYALISLGKTCSTRGGLIIYLKENLKYKMLDMSLKSNIWEGQFIEIYGDSMCAKKIILGNIYRPPRDINEKYRQFIDEFTTVLAKLERSHSDVSSLQEILILTSLKFMKNKFSVTISMQ